MHRFFTAIVGQRWLVFVAALALIAGGLANLSGLSIDAVPDISPKQVMILTQAQGLGPLEVEKLVSFPIENAMAGLPALSSVRSLSRFGLSAVYVTFDDGADLGQARALANERLQTARETMPPNVGTPELGPLATGLGEIFQFEVRGPGHTPMELRQLLQWTITPKLKLVPGVVDVNIYGGQMQTFEVRIGADALRRYGLSLTQVFQALSDNNQTRGGAYLDHGDEQEVIRGLALATGPDDIGNIVLATGPDGTPITVSTVGQVVTAPKVRLGRGHPRRPGRNRCRRGPDALRRECQQGGRRGEGGDPRHPEAVASGGRDPAVLRPLRPGEPHHRHRHPQPDRGRRPGDRRPAAAAGQPARRTDRRLRHPAVHAARLRGHAPAGCLRQPHEPGRHRTSG